MIRFHSEYYYVIICYNSILIFSYILIPKENKKDLTEVPKTVIDSIEIIPVKNVDEVLKVALTKPLKRVEWVEVDQISKKEKIKEELSTH